MSIIHSHLLRHAHPTLSLTLGLTLCLTLCACGEDRSGEMPVPPTVQTLPPVRQADSLLLEGRVLSSPNSRLTECGFVCGNETSRAELPGDTTTLRTDGRFSAHTAPLAPGRYYVCAHATNGMGRAEGDTLWVEVE